MSAAGEADAGLASTAQLMLFSPGLYSVGFSAPHAVRTSLGLPLPCVRLDPVPPAADGDGRAWVSGASEGGWVHAASGPVMVLVTGGAARLVLTVLKAGPDMASPELRITPVPGAPVSGAPVPGALAPIALPLSGAPPAEADGPPLALLVHATGAGDLRAGSGEWAGMRGGTIEGFQLLANDLAGLEYQAIMGEDWNTPWFRDGAFCGSRGLSLALLGVRVRASGALAATHRCVYWGMFQGAGLRGPFRDGEACLAGREPLEALKVVLEAR